MGERQTLPESSGIYESLPSDRSDPVNCAGAQALFAGMTPRSAGGSMFRPTRFAALAALSRAAMSQAWAVPAADAARPTFFHHFLNIFYTTGFGLISPH